MSSEPIPPAPPGTTAPNPRPADHVCREDLLREFFELQERLDTLTENLAAHSANSPAAALLLNLGLERTRRRLGHHQLLGTQTARHSLAHELPASTLNKLRDIIEHPAGFIAGNLPLPADPPGVPTGRVPHKDTAELLEHTCSIGTFETRDRLEAAAALLPHTKVYREIL